MKDPRTIEEQAVLLARWLEEHPGTAPPEGVDPDVLEAIYVLRPDLAPAPTFSIDDILAGVTTGPFAAPQTRSASAPADIGELIELPRPAPLPDPAAPAEPPEVARTPPGVVDLAAERRHRRPWMWSTVGAVAAAAMALIVALPHLDQGISDEALYAPLQSEPSAAPAQAGIAELEDHEALRETPGIRAPEPAGAEEDPALRRIEPATASPDAQEDDGALAPGGAMDSTDALADGFGATSSRTRPSEPREDQAKRKDGTLAPKAEAETLPEAGWYAQPGDALSLPPAAGPGLGASGTATNAQTPTPPSASSAPAAQAVPRPTGASAATADGDREAELDFDAGDVMGYLDELDEAALTESYDRSGAITGGESGRAERKRAEAYEPREAREPEEVSTGEAAPTTEPLESDRSATISASRGRTLGGGRDSQASKTRADNVDDLPVMAEASAVAGQGSLDSLRAVANPLDYRSDWYLSDPGLDPATKASMASAYGQAQAAMLAGDSATAMATLAPLLSSSIPRVVQDAAFRSATLQLQLGQRSAALATVDRGLAASPSPTVHRSRLLALRGSILEEQGDNAGAMDAYRRAADANASRY